MNLTALPLSASAPLASGVPSPGRWSGMQAPPLTSCYPWVCTLASIPQVFCTIESKEHYTVRWWNSSRAQGFTGCKSWTSAWVRPVFGQGRQTGRAWGVHHTQPCQVCSHTMCVCRETETHDLFMRLCDLNPDAQQSSARHLSVLTLALENLDFSWPAELYVTSKLLGLGSSRKGSK